MTIGENTGQTKGEKTMNSKHTIGPWAVEHPFGEPGVYVTTAYPDRSGPLICRLVDQAQTPEGAANARLIAAAPDLLAALEAVTSDHDGMVLLNDGIADKVRAAIARATGK
jgi:hypothetical protein